MITKELKKFTDKVSSDITNITQVYSTAQENTGKLVENAIWQALTKAQNTTTSSRNFRVNYANPSYETNWTSAWLTSNLVMSQQPDIDKHHTHRTNEAYTPPQTYTNQQHHNQTSSDFNEYVIELLGVKLIWHIAHNVNTNKPQMH